MGCQPHSLLWSHEKWDQDHSRRPCSLLYCIHPILGAARVHVSPISVVMGARQRAVPCRVPEAGPWNVGFAGRSVSLASFLWLLSLMGRAWPL